MRIVVTVAEEMAQLSPREAEVMELLAKGLTNKEIGTALDMAPSTVGCHVANMMDVLGVPNRLLLCLWGVANPACIDGVAVPRRHPLPFSRPLAPALVG